MIIADTARRKAWRADTRPPDAVSIRCFETRDERQALRIEAELRDLGYEVNTAPPKTKRIKAAENEFQMPLPKIAAVTCFFNPAGFKTLRENYDRFAAQFERDGWPQLFTVEIAFRGQRWTMPKREGLKRLRARHKLWLKENVINIAARDREFIPKEFDAIAWIDCDLIFTNDAWAEQAIEKLRESPVVQLYERITHLDRQGEPIQTRKSVTAHLKGLDAMPEKFGDHPPGGAWAAHREFFDRFGLYDRFITGGGDALAHGAFVRQFDPPYLRGFENDVVAEDFRRWAAPVARHVRGDVDFVDGEIKHLWHGDRTNRQYAKRQHYLQDFDPSLDLKQNPQTGLLEWATNKPELHERHEQYFQQRKEDG